MLVLLLHEQIDHLSYTKKNLCSLIHDFSKNKNEFKTCLWSRFDAEQDPFLGFIYLDPCYQGHVSIEKKFNRANCQSCLLDLKIKGKVSDFFLYSLVFKCLVGDEKIEDAEMVWDEICCLSRQFESMLLMLLFTFLSFVMVWDEICFEWSDVYLAVLMPL